MFSSSHDKWLSWALRFNSFTGPVPIRIQRHQDQGVRMMYAEIQSRQDGLRKAQGRTAGGCRTDPSVEQVGEFPRWCCLGNPTPSSLTREPYGPFTAPPSGIGIELAERQDILHIVEIPPLAHPEVPLVASLREYAREWAPLFREALALLEWVQKGVPLKDFQPESCRPELCRCLEQIGTPTHQQPLKVD